jgi:uncharacterized lipoprotein YmbA
MKAILSNVKSRRPRAGRAGLGYGGLTAVLCLLLSGCPIANLPQAQPDPTRYYLLNATGAGFPADIGAAERRWVVGLRAVEVPSYLQSKSFAVRSAANEIKYLDFTSWGEPLDQGIMRVLAADLQSFKNVARVSLPPFRPDEPRDYEILVRVTACEGAADGSVQFAADWRVAAPGGAAPVAEGSYDAPALRWDGHDYGQLAARLSEAVAGLSREIGAALPHQPAG